MKPDISQLHSRDVLLTRSTRVGILLLLLMATGCFSTNPVPPAGLEIVVRSNPTLVPEVSLEAVGAADGNELAPAALIKPELVRAYKPAADAPTSLVVDRSGTRAYVATASGKVLALEAAKGEPMKMTTLLSSDTPFFSLALTNDGTRLAFSKSSYVGVLDLREQRLVSQLTLVEGRIQALAWDRGGDLLALGRSNGDVFVWDGSENNTRSIEQYTGASSPIVGLQFHPRARALFVLERAGGLYLWRVLRTEYQLGLRDETADVDKAQQGRLFVTIGYLPGASELWVSDDGEEILAMSQDGQIFGWAVRGLIGSPVVDVGVLHASALYGIRSLPAGKTPLMLVGGRGQQLQLWCRVVRPELTNGLLAVPVVEEGQRLGVPPVPDESAEGEEISAKTTPEVPPALLASTPVLPPTVVAIRAAADSVWVAFGNGSVARLTAAELLSTRGLQARLSNCSGAVPRNTSMADRIQ